MQTKSSFFSAINYSFTASVPTAGEGKSDDTDICQFGEREREREKRQFREYQKMVPVVNVIKLFWRKSRFLQN